MASTQPAELEQKAERAVRRGELLVAIEHFEAYLAQQPDDERVRLRMESVRALLQPSELVARRRSEPEEPQDAGEQLSDAELGEMHASSGRFKDAIGAYERAVQRAPQNELLRERLDELRAMAGPSERADLGRAERLETPPTSNPPPARGARSAKAIDESFSPLPAQKPLPKDPRKMLEELLARIQRGRRK